MFTFLNGNTLRFKTNAMIEIHSPTREEIKNFLKKIESRIRRNEGTLRPPHKYESRL